VREATHGDSIAIAQNLFEVPTNLSRLAWRHAQFSRALVVDPSVQAIVAVAFGDDCANVLIQRMGLIVLGVWAITQDLLEHRKVGLKAIARADIFDHIGNFFISAVLLEAELIAGKCQNGETSCSESLLQFPHLRVLRAGCASEGCNVHD